MIKKIALTLAVAGVASGAWARHLTPAQALERLDGVRSAKRAAQLKTQVDPEPVFEVKVQDQAMAYVFDNNGKGFLVLSADDAVRPLLGYSDSDTFDPSDIPVNMMEWLDGYARQIAYAQANPGTGLGYVKTQTQDFAPILPLCSTRWNQDAPYNNNCPMQYTSRSVTGCLATAEAQVLKYHNWPESLTGSISYTWKAGNTTLKCDFDTIPLDWNNMLDVYTAKEPGTDAQKLAVARLMHACGMASQMNYSSSESGATSTNGASGLAKYFGCTQTAVLLGDWLLPDDLNAYVYNYLATRGPLLYCGYSSSGGHAFVCDGYQGDGYFHFNWGWGGQADGYFVLNALNPGSTGIGGGQAGYNNSQQLIPGIHKPVVDENFVPIIGGDGGFIIEDWWDGVPGDTVGISGAGETNGFFNFQSSDVIVTYGVKFVHNATGTEKIVESFNPNNYNLGSFRGWRVWGIKLPLEFQQGTYTLTGVFKTPDTDWHPMFVDQNSPTYSLMTYDGDSCRFSRPTPAPALVTQAEFQTPAVAGGGFVLTAQFTATGDRDFQGNVRMVLGEYEGDEFLADWTSDPFTVYAKKGTTVPIKVEGTLGNTKLKGTYDVVFMNEKGAIISEGGTVKVTPWGGQPVVTATEAKILNANSVDPNNLRVNLNLNCTVGYFSNQLQLVFGPLNDKGEITPIGTATSPTYYVLKDNSQEVEFGTAFSAAPGTVLHAQVQWYNASPSVRKTFVLTEPMAFTVGNPDQGVEVLTPDQAADDSQARYYNLQGVEVPAQNLTPGLYIRHSAGTSTKVRVK